MNTRPIHRCLPHLIAVTLLAALAICQTASAQSATAKAEVTVILARDTGHIDAALKQMEALQKPPFSSFKGMTILKKHTLVVTKGKPIDVQLPNGRMLQLHIVDALPDGRFKIKVSINKPKQKDYLPLLQVIASPTEPFFIAGQSYQGGTMIIGVQVSKVDAPKAPKKSGK